MSEHDYERYEEFEPPFQEWEAPDERDYAAEYWEWVDGIANSMSALDADQMRHLLDILPYEVQKEISTALPEARQYTPNIGTTDAF